MKVWGVSILDSGRWCETVIPTGADGKPAYFAEIWGFSGARTHTKEKIATNRLLTLAFLRAMSFGDVPYYLVGDFNLQTEESEVLKQKLSEALCYL